MDLLSYYRQQAGSARGLARVYQERPATKAALERVAKEYDGIAEDVEKWCGRDPTSRYAVAEYIDTWRTRWDRGRRAV